ncbi:MAG: hypothetical protein HY049_15635 [Acidobacteria bacterium]|nr:hypothetical protein [Acidobacteriota bacterium]
MTPRPSRVAVVGGPDELLAIARALAPWRFARTTLVGRSPGEGDSIAREAGPGAAGGRDLGAIAGADVVVLGSTASSGPDLRESGACLARYAAEAIVICAAEDSLRCARAVIESSRLSSRRVLAIGGAASARHRAGELAARHGVDAAQVSLLVAGGDAPDLVELKRYTAIAGIPARILDGDPATEEVGAPRDGSRGPERSPTSLSGRAWAASLLAGAVITDTRRVVCCGVFAEGSLGMAPLFGTLPAIVGRNGCEEIFPAALTLEERSFVQRAAGG